jgi:hypothetical protein
MARLLGAAAYDNEVETTRVIRLPVEHQAADHVLADLVAAIELVAGGGARRVVLAGIPGIEAVAGEAIPYAQAAHVGFALRRSPGGQEPAVVVGPREA